jgi:DNA-binding CsgD family transcriptional regulator
VQSDRLHKLVELIYEASADEECWPDVTTTWGRLFNDSIVALDYGATSESADVPLVSSYEFDDAARDLHFDEYRKPQDNPGVAALLKAPLNAPVPIASFLSKRAFNSDPSVRAILKPQGIDKGLLNALKRDHIALSFINVFRRRSQPDFDSQERQALQILGRHLSKSLEIRQITLAHRFDRLQDYQFERYSARLDGFMQLSRSARVIHADQAACQILDESKSLKIKDSGLEITKQGDGPDTDALRSFILDSHPSYQPLVIREGEKSAVAIRVLGRGEERDEWHLRTIHLTYYHWGPKPDIAVIATTFSLTPAEARVVKALSQSANATGAAVSLGISRDTMKRHLSNIYAKAGVETLQQFMMLIGRLS